MKQKIGIFIPVTLGMLTAFGPFVTDFYLPLMPEMASYFKTSPSMIAMSLTASMVGLSLGQILIGPLSDKYGRKHLLVVSMALFVLSTILCILSPNVFLFNVFRLIQGFAGAGGVVLAKSISTDMFTGKELADFMAILGAIHGVAPVMAPLLGGGMARFTSWRGVFCLLLAIGVVLLVCTLRLRESLTRERRSTANVLHTYGNLFWVFRNRLFTLPTLAMMFTFVTFFAYISSSPFIFQQTYGLSPFSFSLCFALNAFMIGGGAALAAKFRKPANLLRMASVMLMVWTVLVSLCLIFHLSLWLLMLCYLGMLLSFGLMQPVTTALALDAERANAGAASAIFGAGGFLSGALVSPLVSVGNMMVSTSVAMMAGALGCLIFSSILVNTLRKRQN